MKFDVDAITNANAARLTEQALAALRAGDTLFDLSAVARCDSSAVALLLAVRRAAREHGAGVRLEGVPRDLASLAELYGVEKLIDGG